MEENASLFDFQVNGFAGVDFQSADLNAEQMVHAVEALLRHQTTGILFTLVTDTIDGLCRKLENIEKICQQNRRVGAVVKGYHIEGPWISREPGFHGAHDVELAREPNEGDYLKLRDAANGRIRLITLAPEVNGTLETISIAVKDGIRVSLGHTNASERAIDDAISAGATMATHVGNAVPLMMHRHDNVMQRLLARDELIACLIPDGIHLPPFVLRNFFRAKPENRVFFTTDCMAAAGAPPGTYTIGPHVVNVGEDGIVHLPGDTRFAGSSLTLDQGVKNIVRWLGVNTKSAIRYCSTLPAEHFGFIQQ